MMQIDNLTPLMKQYYGVKQQFLDALVLFQVGDFYELFFDDAKTAAAYLGITLTKRGKSGDGEPIPLCGVPVHALDHYLTKLVRGGFKVVLCDQLEEAQPGKMVERGVTRVLTPATLTEASLLDEKNASFLFSFFPLEHSWGLVFGELMTAQLFGTVLHASSEKILESELVRFVPDEIVLPPNKLGKQFQSYFKQQGYFISLVDQMHDHQQHALEWLQHFKSDAQKQFDQHESLRLAVLNFYAYLRKTNEPSLNNFNSMQWYKPDDFVMLDSATQRNLEIIKNNYDGGREHTLCAALDGAVTGMGSRMIKKWILRPLVKPEAILQRHDAVQECVTEVAFLQQIKDILRAIGDLERVIGRIALRRGQVNDYLQLGQALAHVPQLKQLLQGRHATLLVMIVDHIYDFSLLYRLLVKSLNDDSSKPWVIRSGFDQRLDRARELVDHSTAKIAALEQQEIEATGISSLKIRFNQVHGYYVEITKTHYDAVPARYIRRQTLVGRERFTTHELQSLEQEIATAHRDIVGLEQALFDTIKQEVARHITPLRKLAQALSHLDALGGFATSAYDYGYVRPLVTDNRDIVIVAGRHPVVERELTQRFIANDTTLTDEQSLWIITGPNMGGKSTYLRQVAQIVLMAQCGSFVPAAQAQLPIVDRIFTRIGAGDNLVGGKSTFMVEMEETAAICSLATSKSLVILDEVGRGTSTFDGLAIAQAVVEYLYTTVKARCIFATHYHELTALQATYPTMASYYAASTKTSSGIVFLYKIIRGVADGSFGIEVAKLAALPSAVIERAQQIVTHLSEHEMSGGHSEHANLTQNVLSDFSHAKRVSPEDEQWALLQAKLKKQEEQLTLLHGIDYDNLSPKKAFDLLWRLKEMS